MKAIIFLFILVFSHPGAHIAGGNFAGKLINKDNPEGYRENNSFAKLIGALTHLKMKIDSSSKYYEDYFQKKLSSEDSLAINQMVSRSFNNATELYNIRVTFNVPVSQNYLNDIDDDAELIEQVIQINKISFPEKKKVELVNSDLRVKREYANDRKDAPLSDINVIARTKNYSGKEVPNYEVWFVVEKYGENRSRYRSFDTVSSPTNRLLSPGNYFFWTRSREKRPKVSDQQFHEIVAKSPEKKIDVSTED
jgi:hypothetical protein